LVSKPHDRFFWGALGVVAVEVARYISLVSTGKPFPHVEWILYFAIYILSACIGGAFAMAWKTDTAIKAIWIGASWPAIIAKLVQAAP
jgi:hypothetical protein